jgi:hypothetical protein
MGLIWCPSQRQWEPLAFLPYSASVTQGGAGSPPPLVEVNQAILAWSLGINESGSTLFYVEKFQKMSWFQIVLRIRYILIRIRIF